MTGPTADRLGLAITAIDAVNAADPVTVVVRGRPGAKELAHAELMTLWVRHLDPAATEAQMLAARAHHLRRWAIPRSSYPDGRSGYLRWRTALKNQHAEEVADLLAGVGYDETVIAEVQRIIKKVGLGKDPAVQVHEDALCLTFLETQLSELAERLGDDHAVEVIRKTAAKMSSAGLAEVAGVEMTEHDRELIERALAG